MNAPILWRLSLAALLVSACDPAVVETDGGFDAGEVTDSAAPDGGLPDAGSDASEGPIDGGPECGDGVTQAPEVCDGDCPTTCDDATACTADELTGSAEECNAMCSSTPITSCQDGDGCCAGGCDVTTDDDCSASCGNGTVEAPETCDGDCPTACDDSMACTTDTLVGSAASCSAECSFVAVTMCTDGDGCCPSGCNATTDDDCSPTCGNGVIEAPETCDGACPTACEDAMACTTDTLVGSAASCSAECSYVAIAACSDGDGCCPSACNATNDDDCSPTCGNGVVEALETCDGACPTACDDSMVCTTDTLVGSAASCSAQCSYVGITMCTDGDGCCPSACNATNDDDCSPTCGNGIVEAPETCDGACPTACDDSMACTADTLVGAAASCSAECSYVGITMCTDGDGCCPSACTAFTDDDCAPTSVNLTNFASGVTAVNHPAGAGVYGTWYDATYNAFADAATGTLESMPAMAIDDLGFGNGVYAIFSGAVPATGNYRVEVRMHVVEIAPDLNGVRAYQIGVATGASAVHRGTEMSLLAGLPTAGNYATMTTGDDTSLGPVTAVTPVFAATAGEDVLIGFGTDVTSGLWNGSSGTWDSDGAAGPNPGAYVVVGDVMLIPVP